MATRLTNAGRDPFAHHGYVNTPVYHASTLLYPSAQDYLAHRGRYQYGRRGTPTSEALETALADIEGPQCEAVALLPSGLAAISTALLSVVRAGDHVLVTDSAYGPTRKFCDTILTRYGVTTTYYDPSRRRRHRGADAAQHPRGLRRESGLADVRSPGRSGHRRRRACPQRHRADGQYLGEPDSISAPSRRASISRSSPAPNISAAIPT